MMPTTNKILPRFQLGTRLNKSPDIFIGLCLHLVLLLCDVLFCFAFYLLKSIHFRNIIVHRYKSFSHGIRENDGSVDMCFVNINLYVITTI